MYIDDDHLYHGAALIQIAEHDQFTAINSMVVKKIKSRSAYKINDNIGVYFKYASKPHGKYKEYYFTFTQDRLKELRKISEITPNLFISCICVKAKQICLLSYSNLLDLINRRIESNESEENQYTILINLPKGKGFRVYISPSGEKKKTLGKMIISRNDFPDAIFK